jgi:uncharacterized damage-inducible protein DinB
VTDDDTTQPSPAPERTDIPAAWDERTSLLTLLEYTRATARYKCENLAEEHARAAPLPTSPLMTISGLVNHMRWVEYSWIDVVFFGGEDEGPWTKEDPDREFSVALDHPLEQVLAEYKQLADEHDAKLLAVGLDAPARRKLKNGDHPTLRWIILHLIEENARHNGHIDILRELADGVTGD